jgi:transcriptional regulator with XRE-family HTH domain
MKKLTLNELVSDIMEEDGISVRKMAKKADVSPRIIQEIRSKKKTNINLSTFFKLMEASGMKIIIKDNATEKETILN